jgi:hypothetical protein
LDGYKQKLIRKLKTRCSELNEELCEVESLFNQAVPLFCAAVDNFCKSKDFENPLNSLKDDKEDEKIQFSSNFKSVYRKIAIETHPDKGVEDDKKLELYHDATDAKKNQQIDKIISIAKDLKIDIYDFSFEDIKLIEQSMSDTEEKINKIRSSYPWAWFFSNVKKRDDIISGFVLNKV